MIHIENMTKIYRMGKVEVRALDGVSIDIEEGEFVAITGPSGSGKSTFMHLLGCLDTPTSGTYILNGSEVSKLRQDKLAEIRNKEIGFVFQEFNLLPRLTALENVELPLIYRGMPVHERRQRAMDALEKVGLANRLNHRPTEMSGGQQQRVAIARALVGDPNIILADEPTGNLDSRSAHEVMDMLKDLNSAGRTVILITHDMSIASEAKRIVRILDGRILSDEVVS
ncbi:ABC transporter ATP-binding protein [Calorimonas adulescens]|uniref:ABC transporter ATP-binding protein n=1 Tax=Calorimonas adulescens TaxID=2606906 RepID=A0A5D8QFH9_9THEO|nr:ABC transporter ATP-binding protein [Calorimonas adulescens]TZE82884.1 ABC transporter ATP-binding protein [Calorimonas adulescens]